MVLWRTGSSQTKFPPLSALLMRHSNFHDYCTLSHDYCTLSHDYCCTLSHDYRILCHMSDQPMTARVPGSSLTPDLVFFRTQSNITVAHAMPGLNNIDANLHAYSSTPDRNEWSASRFVHFRHKKKSPW